MNALKISRAYPSDSELYKSGGHYFIVRNMPVGPIVFGIVDSISDLICETITNENNA